MPESRADRSSFYLYALHLWALFGIALSNVFLGLAVLMSPAVWKRGVRVWAQSADLLVPLSFYACLLLASTLTSRDPLTSLGETSELFTLAAVPLGLAVLDSMRRVRLVTNGLIIVSAGVALLGLSQFLWGFGDLGNRIRGPFSIYMTFAGFLMLADLLLIAQMVFARGWRSLWRWAALLLINMALVGSLTRSAWVALVLVLALLLVLRAPKFLPLFAGALIVGVLLAPGLVRERMLSIADLDYPPNYDRLCMWEAGAHMVAERPLLGIGPGQVERFFPLYRHPTTVSHNTVHLHNSFVQIAAERGLLSLAAYLWLFAAALLAAWRGWREGGGNGATALYVGALLGLVAFNLAGLFEHTWGDTEVQRVALFLVALPFALRAARAEAD